MATVRARDGYVVESAALGRMLRRFVTSQNLERPRNGQFGGEFARAAGVARQGGNYVAPAAGGSDSSPISPVRYLAQESGVSEQTIKKLTMRHPPSSTTPLEIADTLVTVLGHPEAFHDGTLPIGRRVAGSFVPDSDGESLTGTVSPR